MGRVYEHFSNGKDIRYCNVCELHTEHVAGKCIEHCDDEDFLGYVNGKKEFNVLHKPMRKHNQLDNEVDL